MNEFIGPDPADLEKVHSGSYISSVMPFVRIEIEGMMSTVRTRVFTAIRDGSYTPELGDMAWREIYGYHRLIKRLETTVKVGQHVGERVTEHMIIGDPHD